MLSQPSGVICESPLQGHVAGIAGRSVPTRAKERRALSWGQAPALHFSLRPWAVVVRATVVGVAGRRRN